MTRRTVFRLMVAVTLAWLAWVGWSLIGRSHPYELRVLDDLGTPVASAVIDVNGSQVATTGNDGRAEMVWTRSATSLDVSAPGHIPQMLTLTDRPHEQYEIVLKAKVLRGRVVSLSDGDAISTARIDAGSAEAFSDGEGYFQIRGAEEGVITVERPAWLATQFTWDGGTGESVVEMTPFAARAVHIHGESVRDDIDGFIDMAIDTELNALMIDLKDESGLVWYDTVDPTAVEVGADYSAYDLVETVDKAHDVGLYVIGRLVVFNDPVAAIRKPEMAVWDSELNAPYEAAGQYFLDPTDPAARQYGLDLAVEACSAGVDEIQFDYVRFPDNRRESVVFDGGLTAEIRLATITGFLSEAVSLLRPMGCAVAADVFGYLTAAADDGGIGQRWEEIAGIVDVVSPMLYPSHYDADWYGFENPNDYPGEMIDRALQDGLARLTREVVVRPWLQDFGYDPSQVREQISSAESHGLGWMLWNAKSDVTVDALRPAE